jgi:RES domain-containing protein
MSDVWPCEQDLRTRLQVVVSEVAAVRPHVVSWQGTTYRFASLEYADKHTFTNGAGARRSGGRFSPIGGPRTVYLSLDRATATAELDSWYEYYELPDSAFKPRLLAAVAVSVGSLLDLTSPDLLSYLGLSSDHLAQEWRDISDKGGVAPIQMLGRIAYELGFEGLYYSSVRRAVGFNLALFPDNYQEGTHAVMLNSD